jgi:hypothetical protein
MNLRRIITRRKKALKAAKPKSRDRLRHELCIALMAEKLRKEITA